MESDFSEERLRRIAFDIDGVLLDFHGPFLDFYNTRHGTNLILRDITTYDFSHLSQKDRGEFKRDMQDFHQPQNFRDFPALPGALDSLRRLNTRNVLGAVTSRRDYLHESTIFSLNNNLLLGFLSGVHFTNGYSRENRKETKSEICLRHNYGVIIEDCAEYANECAESGIRAFLFTRPWNEQEPLHENVRRINRGWLEILEHFE